MFPPRDSRVPVRPMAVALVMKRSMAFLLAGSLFSLLNEFVLGGFLFGFGPSLVFVVAAVVLFTLGNSIREKILKPSRREASDSVPSAPLPRRLQPVPFPRTGIVAPV